MSRATIAGGAFALFLGLLIVATSYRVFIPGDGPADAAASDAAFPPSKVTHAVQSEPHRDFLYGRVTALEDLVYEGRLRWGGGEEAFWGDYFNGRKLENVWAERFPNDLVSTESVGVKILGFGIGTRDRDVDLGRFFMQRFGDIARVESVGKAIRVTLKSGAVFELDRFAAGDFDDGVRVWDSTHGTVDIGPRQIASIEFLPTPPLDIAAYRLHGTVTSRQGEFSGFVQWNREDCIGSDTLDGRADDLALSLRFDTIGSIARLSSNSSLVTLLDGREVVLSGSREAGDGNRGVYVDDERYGRVLISWDAFERIEFGDGGDAAGYDDYPPGQPLSGSVTTRSGARLVGRLVFDLDEGETTETFDAPAHGVDYTIPFGLIASIIRPGREANAESPTSVTLHHGEQLQFEPAGDLGEANAGMLVFVDGRPRPEYVPWGDVERIEFERPPAMYPALVQNDAQRRD